MDNSNKDFGVNCASNPALFTKCNVIWQTAVSRESLNNYL